MEELKAKYVEVFGKEVPVNKKNDQEWIENKLKEAQIVEEPSSDWAVEEAKQDEVVEQVVVSSGAKIVPEFDEYKKLQSYYGFVDAEALEPKELQKRYNLSESDMKLVAAFNVVFDEEKAKSFVMKGRHPDYIVPIVEKYGLLNSDFFNNEELEKKILFGAEWEAEIASRRAEIKQVQNYSLVVKWPLKW